MRAVARPGVGFEMGRREDEAFAGVIESVILDIIGEAKGELEVGKVEEVSNRGLVLGFVKATRQGAADGYILQEVLIQCQNRPPIFTEGASDPVAA